VSSAALFLGGALENREEWSLTDFVSMVTDFFAGADEPSAVEALPALPPPPAPTPPPAEEGIVPIAYQTYHVLTVPYDVRGAQVQGNWIYFYYILLGSVSPTIVVERISHDGSLWEQVVEIPWEMTSDGASTAGFGLDREGNIRFLTWFWYRTEPDKLLDTLFDRTGALLSERDLSDLIFTEEGADFNTFEAFFTDDGDILLRGHREDCSITLYVIASDGSLSSERDTECGLFARVRAGGAILVNSMGSLVFDFETRAWYNQISENSFPVMRIYSAPGNSDVDLYLDLNRDGERLLFGFDGDREEVSLLLNWSEKGFQPRGWDTLLFLPREQIIWFHQSLDGPHTYILVFPYQVRDVVSVSDL